jgi:hypothetical protein
VAVTEPEEPTRWKHGAAAGAPDGFAELAHAEARGGPTDAALAHMIEKLAAQAAAPELARAFHAATGTARSSAPSVRLGLLSKLIAGACAFAAIAIGLLALNAARRSDRPSVSAPAHAAVAASTQPRATDPSAIVTPVDTVAASVHVTPERSSSRPTQAHDSRKPAMDAADELRLLELAQQALRDDPGRALAIAERHRRLFARGQFAQEREVLAIQALLALGRHERASARARAFAHRYPESSHLPHLRDLVRMTP